MGKLASHPRKKTRRIIARLASGSYFLQTWPTSLAPFHAQARLHTPRARTYTHEYIERTHKALAVPLCCSIALPYTHTVIDPAACKSVAKQGEPKETGERLIFKINKYVK